MSVARTMLFTPGNMTHQLRPPPFLPSTFTTIQHQKATAHDTTHSETQKRDKSPGKYTRLREGLCNIARHDSPAWVRNDLCARKPRPVIQSPFASRSWGVVRDVRTPFLHFPLHRHHLGLPESIDSRKRCTCGKGYCCNTTMQQYMSTFL